MYAVLFWQDCGKVVNNQRAFSKYDANTKQTTQGS